jgi:hypothetical protein
MITKMPRKMPIFDSAEGMARRPAPRTITSAYILLVMVRNVLVLARLITLDIHVAWPWNPESFLPRPRLLLSVTCQGFQCEASDRLPRSDPVLEDIWSASAGSWSMAEYVAMSRRCVRCCVIARSCGVRREEFVPCFAPGRRPAKRRQVSSGRWCCE